MEYPRNGFFGRFKLKAFIIYVGVIAGVLVIIFTDIFRTEEAGTIPQMVWFLFGLVVLLTLIIILSRAIKIIDLLERNRSNLEKMAELSEKDRSVLGQIKKNIELSESAKSILYRDADMRTLHEEVFAKLQQKDFDGAYEFIDEIAKSVCYKELAEQLRLEADRYRDSTDQERVTQVVGHIEKLFDRYQWTKASELIERLIKAEPQSEKAKEMRQRLIDKKDERKKVLLTAWDDAVKRQATNRSLEILQELDLYLTPNEGLALQEAARDVFRNKLHSLGVRFSLAVSGKNWETALQTGEEIIKDFPNSRMAEEIRERIEILQEKIKQQGA